MDRSIQSNDLEFFSVLAACGSLNAAGRRLGITTAAVSRRLALMESRLGASLMSRTTRRMSLTPEGELCLERARRILDEIEDLTQLVGGARSTPAGLLRVNATPGFGRRRVAEVVSQFMARHPQVEVQLQLTVDPPPFSENAFDVCVWIGEPPDARVVARRLAPNQRVLCAAPSYLEAHGVPRTARDLAGHKCLVIRQGSEAYGIWRLYSGRGQRRRAENVRIRGPLITNDGEVAVRWALDGHGILLRATWDIGPDLRGGRLVQVLSQYQTPGADIYAVYPYRHQTSARIRVFVDFLAAALKT
jgi:DNA-binding transcriptional LysR family regulator